jgi:hypothetical protein
MATRIAEVVAAASERFAGLRPRLAGLRPRLAGFRSRTDGLRERLVRIRARVPLRPVAVAAGVVVLVVIGGSFLIRLLDSSDGGASGASGLPGDVATIVFPTTTDVFPSFPEESRMRPVGVRILAVELEGPVVAVSELPACPRELESADRVRWFDAEPVDGAGRQAVAPGEHGVALLVAGADVTRGDGLFSGIESVEIGQLVETARSNGTVLAWAVVDVVDLPAGAPFPDGLLGPADEPRLALVGCGATVDAGARDRYVLARRVG